MCNSCLTGLVPNPSPPPGALLAAPPCPQHLHQLHGQPVWPELDHHADQVYCVKLRLLLVLQPHTTN